MKVDSSHVAVSFLLRTKFPRFFGELRIALEAAGVTLHQLEGTRDFWARDYCPIQRHDGKVVTYTYRPDYLRGYGHLITDWKQIRELPGGPERVNCELVLDGGNVVLHDRTAIVTNKIFTENPQLSHREVEDRLRNAFELEKLILVPPEPGDLWGHSDGMVAWSSRGRVLMNDWTKIDPAFHRQVKGLLKRSGVEVTEIPYALELQRRSIPSAQGCYVNLLALPQIVLMPTYGIPTDKAALAKVQSEFSDRRVVTIDAAALAKEGGSVHCVTCDYAVEP